MLKNCDSQVVPRAQESAESMQLCHRDCTEQFINMGRGGNVRNLLSAEGKIKKKKKEMLGLGLAYIAQPQSETDEHQIIGSSSYTTPAGRGY